VNPLFAATLDRHNFASGFRHTIHSYAGNLLFVRIIDDYLRGATRFRHLEEGMRKRLTNEKQYPFAWLDEVTELTLNPQKGNLDQLKADELTRLQQQFETEVRQIIRNLKVQTFWIYSVKKKKAVLLQYAEAIRLLKIQVAFNRDHYPENSTLKKSRRCFYCLY